MQSAIAAAWAYQDCERPLDLSEQWVAKVKLLKEQLAESKKKLTAKEEQLKGNEIDLVAKSEELEKAQTEIRKLRGELARLRDEVRSLRPQLEQAKTAATNAQKKVHKHSCISWQPYTWTGT